MPIVLLLLACVVLFFVAALVIGKLIGIILLLVVATLCGAVAEYVLGHREGVGETLLIGLMGAVLGVIIRAVLHLPGLITIAGVPIFWAILGSVIIVALLKLARPQPRSMRRLR